MADGQQTKKNSKEAIAVNKAIPKVVAALEAIISRTKDERFRERCLQKLLIKEKTDLACKLESKLWEIAKQRLGVKQMLSQGDASEQVVPEQKTSSQTSQVKTNSRQIPSTEKDPFDDLALIDMTYPLSDANFESFYENENLNNIHDIPVQKPPFLLATNSLSSESFSQDKLVGEVPLMDPIEHSSLHSKDDKTDSVTTKDDWLDNFAEDSFWMDSNQDCSSLESGQNLLKKHQSPLSSSKRKIVTTRSEPNLHAYSFIHHKGQERNGTEVVIISDEEEEHCERKLEAKSQNHKCISSPIKSEITNGKTNNSDGPSHQNVFKPCSQNVAIGHKNNDTQVVEPCKIKDTVIVDGKVPDLHGVSNKLPLTMRSPKLELIADHSIIHDFDALEDSFDD